MTLSFEAKLTIDAGEKTKAIFDSIHTDNKFYPENPTKTEISFDKQITIFIESKQIPHLRAQIFPSVIGVFSDNSVIDVDGNLFDACSYATTAAILTTKIPKWEIQDETPVLIEDGDTDAPITTIPVSVTMGRIGEHIIVDPNGDEWDSMDARITITTNSDGNICALQKGGTHGFTQEQLIKCGEISVSVGAKIREILKQTKENVQ